MTDTQTIAYKRIAELEDMVAHLRAEIDNLQAPRPAPTIMDIIGPEAFDRLVELHPSFRESGTPTRPNDAASEVLWSAIRMVGRSQKENEQMHARLTDALVGHSDLYARLERATNALAEYAMRAAEEGDQ
jgi:hypothetical protein